jgi:hypothetical protein
MSKTHPATTAVLSPTLSSAEFFHSTGDVLRLTDLRRVLTDGVELVVENFTRQYKFQMRHYMSPRQVLFLLRGGLINWMKERLAGE